MKLILKLSLCLLLIIGLPISNHAQQGKIPTGKIVDTENIFTKADIKILEAQIDDFIQTTKIPMSIMVRSMSKTSANDNAWTIGDLKSPKGILILISKSSKEISIGVGNELSKTLTKAKVDDIINSKILTEFNKDQYTAGISNSIKAFFKQLVH